ncbi:MAG: hypothetical protein WC980_06980 [Candidatus Brocadiia bacterium]
MKRYLVIFIIPTLLLGTAYLLRGIIPDKLICLSLLIIVIGVTAYFAYGAFFLDSGEEIYKQALQSRLQRSLINPFYVLSQSDYVLRYKLQWAGMLIFLIIILIFVLMNW